MSDAAATVCVIDDDPSIRDAVGSLLRSVGLRVRSFGSVKEFTSAGKPRRPGCLVLDIRLPGKSGLDFHEEIARTETSLPVIFITGHGDIQMSVRAMKAGAVDFLTKPFRDQELLDAVQLAIERDRGQIGAVAALADLRKREAGLTPRERQVMRHVVSGRPNREIAANLGISEITVKAHRGKMMRKMAAQSVADLVRMSGALEGGP
jgi:FixJ family two-component response regulator